MLKVEIEREEDGRWIAEVPALPGALAYDATADEARAKAEALAFRIMAERIAHGEPLPPEAHAFANAGPAEGGGAASGSKA